MAEIETPDVDALLDCERAFEELGAPQPGDRALLDRAMTHSLAAAKASAAAGAASGLSTTTWLAILAGLAGVVAVVVSQLGPRVAPTVESPAADAEQPDPPPLDDPPAPAKAAVPTPAPQPDPPTQVDVDEPITQRPNAPPKRQRTAAELLEQANAARKANKTARALALYGQLFKVHPRSREAKTARVSAGRLYLESGKPKAALSQFSKYLSGSPSGNLAEEAAAGRATALGRLGRAEAEREAWTQLLDRHPGSVHAARAKKRIAELSPD